VTRSRLGAWLGWVTALTVATVVLRDSREDVDTVHVLATYLLIVLGGSVGGGRPLGLALTVLCFLSIDIFFQSPYDRLAVGKPLDWVVLVAFLTVSGVTTELLARERARAAEAERRTLEVTSLGRLGAETLSAGRAEEMLTGIADLIRGSLGVAECRLYEWEDGTLGLLVSSPPGPRDPVEPPRIKALLALAQTANDAPGHGLITRDADPTIVDVLLKAHGHVAGALHLRDALPIALDAARERFLDALSYYAALAVERARLIAQAEQAAVLEEVDRMKDIVLASVSHDLRTPLTTIKALARDSSLRGDPNAAMIEEQADRLARLVADLLDLSRLKSGVFPISADLNTAEDLVGAALRQVSGVLGDRVVDTKLALDEPALVGRFDFSQALRILGNLLENAARHSPGPSPIEVSVRREGPSLVFEVADRGPGIPASERERVFEAFYRTADAGGGGAGLGLAIARGLAERQGGSLEYAPRPGGGSIFLLRLPAGDLPANALVES